MKYKQMLEYILNERTKLEESLDAILRGKNKKRPGMHIGTPPVQIKEIGKGRFQVVGGGLFSRFAE